MKLFIIHAGYYDDEIGIYEMHTNFVAVAADVIEVKALITNKDIFIKKKMHIDAIQEIEAIDGYKITLNATQSKATKLINYDYTQIKQLG